jgi:Cdc6-like AAA superfamily ATPase
MEIEKGFGVEEVFAPWFHKYEIVQMSEKFSQIEKIFGGAAKAKCPKLLVLFGDEGFGKKNAVRWAVERTKKPKPPSFISIDCKIFNQETKFQRELGLQVERSSQGSIPSGSLTSLETVFNDLPKHFQVNWRKSIFKGVLG